MSLVPSTIAVNWLLILICYKAGWQAYNPVDPFIYWLRLQYTLHVQIYMSILEKHYTHRDPAVTVVKDDLHKGGHHSWSSALLTEKVCHVHNCDTSQFCTCTCRTTALSQEKLYFWKKNSRCHHTITPRIVLTFKLYHKLCFFFKCIVNRLHLLVFWANCKSSDCDWHCPLFWPHPQ